MKDFFLVIATILAVFLGSYLNDIVTQKTIRQENRRTTLLEIVSKSELRAYTLQNVVWSSTALNVFPKRWDSYINKGVIPWDSSYYRMKVNLSKYVTYQDTIDSFEELNKLFLNYHRTVEIEVFKLASNGKSRLRK